MKQRFRLYRRSNGGRFYAQDSLTGKQESLGTTGRHEAMRLLHARNEAAHQPLLNVQIARAYLAASDSDATTRNWELVMAEIIRTKKLDSTRQRYERAFKDKALDPLRKLSIVQTRPEHFMRVLEAGTVSTNDNLRRLHNFAVAMTWLPWPMLVKQQWRCFVIATSAASLGRSTRRFQSKRKIPNGKRFWSWRGMWGRRKETWRRSALRTLTEGIA